MRPGPRVQAAIDILAECARSPLPAEQLLKSWGRQNRFAGSKDRAAIGAYVFEVSRHKARYAFEMASWEPRALVLAHLAHVGTDDWQSWFDGSPHAPARLTEAELKQLAERRAELPLAAKYAVPEAWLPEIEATFGAETEAELAAMLERAPIDLRVNALKTARKPARVHLEREGIECSPLENSRHALRIEPKAGIGPRQLSSSKSYISGEVEIQDFGSQWITDQLTLSAGDLVVDYCAGGGGKTLSLAARMRGKGRLIACDIDQARLRNIKPRLKRAGASNVDLNLLGQEGQEGDETLSGLAGEADLVLVDAPCSGSGTWRRHPDAKWRLTAEALQAYQTAQQEVLEAAACLVRPGGELAYVTCSIFQSENDTQVGRFLKAHPDFSPRACPSDLPRYECEHGYQLSPFRSGCDGFYVAFLKRAE